VSTVVGEALDWLAERLQPSGDAAIRGLEQDLARESTLDASWWRVCETAWTLGFVELRMVPVPEMSDILVERQDFAPRPWPMPDAERGRPAAQSIWAFTLSRGGRTVATLTARRRLSRVDFEPLQFVRAIQGIVDRFVGARSGDDSASASAHSGAEPKAALTLVASVAAARSADS
jgi:fermentation-respiration switch protein FrsA (DUF1100 family)